MGLEKKSSTIKKVLVLSAVFLVLVGIVRLNVKEFFRLEFSNDAYLYNFVEKQDDFAYLNVAHVGILFVNKNIKSAIFIFPDTGYDYDIKDLVQEYKDKRDFTGKELKSGIIYTMNGDTTCFYEKNCDENMENVISFAKENNMRVSSYDLINRIILTDLSPKTDNFDLNEQADNLQKFIELYRDGLKKLLDTIKESNIIEREMFPEHLFDKSGVFLVSETDEYMGDPYPSKSLALNILYYVKQAKKNNFSYTRILFPTELYDISDGNEHEVMRKLDYGDGIMIEDGYRQGILLPNFWKETKDVEKIFQQAKINAGLSPTYWSKDIKVYKFKTVEMKYGD